MKEDPMTIDDLAAMIRDQFLHQDERLELLTSEVGKLRIEMREGFARIDQELRSIKERLREIEARLPRVEQRTLEDADALAHDVVDLKKRVNFLEKAVARLKSA